MIPYRGGPVAGRLREPPDLHTEYVDVPMFVPGLGICHARYIVERVNGKPLHLVHVPPRVKA